MNDKFWLESCQELFTVLKDYDRSTGLIFILSAPAPTPAPDSTSLAPATTMPAPTTPPDKCTEADDILSVS